MYYDYCYACGIGNPTDMTCLQRGTFGCPNKVHWREAKSTELTEQQLEDLEQTGKMIGEGIGGIIMWATSMVIQAPFVMLAIFMPSFLLELAIYPITFLFSASSDMKVFADEDSVWASMAMWSIPLAFLYIVIVPKIANRKLAARLTFWPVLLFYTSVMIFFSITEYFRAGQTEQSETFSLSDIGWQVLFYAIGIALIYGSWLVFYNNRARES